MDETHPHRRSLERDDRANRLTGPSISPVAKPVSIGLVLLPFLLLPALNSAAAPFVPGSDLQVLETLPARASDPRMRELHELRRELASNPRDVDVGGAAGPALLRRSRRRGRPALRRLRAGGAGALVERAGPAGAGAGGARHRAAVQPSVRRRAGRPRRSGAPAARQRRRPGRGWPRSTWCAPTTRKPRAACERVASLASPLIGAACKAQVDGVTGHAAAAAAALQSALQQSAEAAPPEQLWALTRLAEIEERRGDDAGRRGRLPARARARHQRHLPAGRVSADFLLDRGRAGEVLALLKDKDALRLLLLRLALAAEDDPRARARALRERAGRAFRRGTPARRHAASKGRGALRARRAGPGAASARIGARELRGAARARRCAHPARGGARRKTAGGRRAAH